MTSSLFNALSWATGLGVVGYMAILAGLCSERVQRELIYLHHIRLPPKARFEAPEDYGFAPGRVRNLKINTKDGIQLGAWLVSYTQGHAAGLESAWQDLKSSNRPVVLFLHGNAASRAMPIRVTTVRLLSDHLRAHVLALDYRGFADSTGIPSEEGVKLDVEAAIEYLHSHGVKAIGIVGSSLGTGIGSRLAADMCKAGDPPLFLALMAPFTSIPDLLLSYKLAGLVPILSPLRLFPRIQAYFQKRLRSRFDTKSIIASVTCPILIAHSRLDKTIPSFQSRRLFSTLASSDQTIETESFANFGQVLRIPDRHGHGPVIYIESLKGTHDNLQTHDGVIRTLTRMADDAWKRRGLS